LRNLHDFDRALRSALDGGRASDHVVASDRDQRLDSQFLESRYRVVQHLPVVRDIGTRCSQNGAAVKVNARHLINVQPSLFSRVARGQPCESVVKSDRRAAEPDRFQRDSGDDAVDSGRRAPANQNAQFLYCHNQSLAGNGEWGVGSGGKSTSSPTPHSPFPTPYCLYANLLLNSSTLKFPAWASFSAHSGFSKSL